MRGIINLKRYFSMEKFTPLENKNHVFDFLKNQKVEYKVYEHASAKTVQDIIGNP